jgi:hypothetical protein
MIVTAVLGVTVSLLFVLGSIGALLYSLFFSKKYMGDPSNFSKTKALDVFMYLGIGISLIVSVTNILTILFTAIDRKFPDILNASQYVDGANGDVRFAIATLVIMFPLYVGLSWYVSRDIAKFLYKRDITIRKIMIYLTMFVTICTLIGTLVSVIYTYLGGELSVRFGYKAVTVFVVALSVFGYYFYSARRNYTEKTSLPLVASLLASVIVIASLVWSVRIIGTPSEMRAKKIDDTRLSDLSSLQQQILNRFQMTDKLPLTTDELINALQGVSVPVDPITNLPYEYKIVQQPILKMNFTTNKKELVTPGIFELCATFETVREYDMNGRGVGSMPISMGTDAFYSATNYYYSGDQSPFWNHKAEDTCFKRIISSDMYYGK